MVKKMENQANLQMRINAALGSLTNLWDAATGTFTNAMVAFATAYAPEMKQLAQSINDVSGSLQTWATNNGPAIKTALKMAGALVGLKLVFFGLGIAFKVLAGMWATNPFILLLMALVTVAPLIYENWGAICSFIKTAWQDTVTGATAIWTNFTTALMSAWQLFSSGIMLGITAVSDAFTALLPASVVAIFSGIIDQITAKFNAFIGFIKSGISGIQSVISGISSFFGQTPNGMRPPGQTGVPSIPKAATTVPKVSNVIPMPTAAKTPFMKVAANAADFLPKASGNQPGTSPGPRKSLVQPQQPVRGNIDVNFKNAPQGMRVTPTKAGGPVSVTPNVGYRSFAGGSA
jgi:hypothetical protein